MTSFIRPSDGAVRQGPHIDLNVRGYRAGERVVVEEEFGRPFVAAIVAMEGNVALIDGRRLLVTKLIDRLPPALGEEGERLLIAELRAAADTMTAGDYQLARRRILRRALAR